MAQILQVLALVAVAQLSFPSTAYAHMEMSWPYPFRSKFDPAITNPDYDNTFPLSADGSNYPCKGYQDLPASQVSKVTYTPGQTYNMSVAGSATHMGGSCQLSLSYDNGRSFKVIKSMIGGCPLKTNWDFTVPSNAPASNNAILAWTWFNLVGNREMYMNCARVTIAGQSVQRYRRYESKRQNSFSTLPDNFVCNVGNGCKTIERREVVFPNPGPRIERNADAVSPDPGPGFILSSTPTGNAFSSVNPNSNSSFSGSTGLTSSRTTYFNSTSLLTVTSSASSSLSSIETSYTSVLNSLSRTATPGFFFTISSTSTTPTATSLTSSLTTTTSVTSSSTTTLTSVTSTSSVHTTLGRGLTTISTSSATTTTTTTASTPSDSTSSVTTASTESTSTMSTSTVSSSTVSTSTESTSTESTSTVSTSMESTSTESTSTVSTSMESTPTESTSSTSTSTASISTPITTTSLGLSSTQSTTSTSTVSVTSTSSSTGTLSTFSTTSITTFTGTFTTVTTSTTSTTPTATIVPTSCTPGSFICNSATTFSQCVSDGSGSGTFVYLGSVAPGTTCVDNTIIRENAGACTPNGSIQCNGETAYYICDQGGLINMGSVAPGTACRDGVIGFA